MAQSGIPEALDALEHVPGWARQNAQQAILHRWVAIDAAAAVAWIGSLPLADQQALSFSVAHAYSNRDPRGAFNWAMSSDPKIRERLLRSVFISIDDATVAEQLFRSIDDPELRTDLAHALYLGRGDGDPVDALRWAMTFEGDVQDRLRSYIFTAWAKTDPDAAVREVLRQRDPRVRDRVATEVISGLLEAFNVDGRRTALPGNRLGRGTRGGCASALLLLRSHRRRSRQGDLLRGDLARQHAARPVTH